MRYHIIGNDIQVRSMSVIGLRGDVVSSEKEAASALDKAIKDSTVGTVLVSESFYSLPEVSAVIRSHEKTGTLPVILCLQDQGSSPGSSRP
ncbi:MAG: hypothetical protein II883_02735 [Spirochaetales bacterium]|nr:hypothetical protein [Spirochaetales bacterium]